MGGMPSSSRWGMSAVTQWAQRVKTGTSSSRSRMSYLMHVA